jgi:hypothetical protein
MKQNKKIVIVFAAVVIVALPLLLLLIGEMRPAEENQRPPLELLMGYTPPENEYPAPDLITQGLPENFVAGEPTIELTQYPDGTPVTVRTITYSKGENGAVVIILDVCGETFLSNTPGLSRYNFESVRIGGLPAVRYTKGGDFAGYVWYHGRYSINVYSSPAGFPRYLTEFAELYMSKYPSTL